jgi:signal peptidase I
MAERSAVVEKERTEAGTQKPASAKAPAIGGATTTSGVKETIESILIAFIFAFMFRAFVVEAFVIPTGSMATTLLGAHMRVKCPYCGYEFDIGYNSNSDKEINTPTDFRDRDGQLGEEVICPNCGYALRTGPRIFYGDRILVLKYIYLLHEPDRWDVVVFKSPNEPATYDYTQNYIKRLVGRPHESVMILDGDVYIGTGDLPKEAFTVQTKPRVVQNALWRIVYDNDFYPRKLEQVEMPWKQPWTLQTPDNGWDLGDSPMNGRVFHFDNPNGNGELYFDRLANSRRLTNWIAYDEPGHPGTVDVGDLKLELYYQRQSGDGVLRMRLSKYDDTFTAEIAPTTVRLYHRMPNGTVKQVGSTVPIHAGNQPMHIELQNVDYQVTVRIDGDDVIQSTPLDYHPDIEKLLMLYDKGQSDSNPTISIEAEQQTCDISHIKLWRDIYYLNRPPGGTGAANPDHVIHLKDDEYFVLGDNSAVSADSRYWLSPINLTDEDLHADAGIVPGRFLLGKAFFVYWPAGYPPYEGAPAIVPNFGEMRFIH